MYGKAVVAALFALAAGASAQTPVDPTLQHSVLLALATAIPSDVVSQAIADPLAFASGIGSSIAAGNAPGWFKALPTDVRGLLPQLYPEATATAPATSISASSTVVVETTTPLSTATSTTRSTGAAASFPTAAVGAGFGAVVGFVGMLAL